jgi:lipopolysaccharide transport system permease protein
MNEILKYKDLFRELVVKDIKMRHKQTIFGVLWVLFQPLMSTLIFTLIFGVILKIPSENIPYPIFVFLGLIFWNFFSNTITTASGSLVGNESLIKKVYFPRLILPLSSIFTNLFDFFISFVFLLILSFIYGRFPSLLFFVFLPFVILVLLIFVIGLSAFLSSLNVRYRDVRQVLPFFIQILIFLTPVFFPLTIVSPAHQVFLAVNPLTPIIDIARSSFQGEIPNNYTQIIISLFISVFTFVFGIYYFKRTEKYFADLI